MAHHDNLSLTWHLMRVEMILEKQADVWACQCAHANNWDGARRWEQDRSTHEGNAIGFASK